MDNPFISCRHIVRGSRGGHVEVGPRCHAILTPASTDVSVLLPENMAVLKNQIGGVKSEFLSRSAQFEGRMKSSVFAITPNH